MPRNGCRLIRNRGRSGSLGGFTLCEGQLANNSFHEVLRRFISQNVEPLTKVIPDELSLHPIAQGILQLPLLQYLTPPPDTPQPDSQDSQDSLPPHAL